MSNHSRRRFGALTVACGALLASSAFASGALADQVQTFASVQLSDAHDQSFQGTKQPDGSCRTGFHATLSPGDRGQVAVEVSRNSTTCAQTFEIGDAPAPDATPQALAPASAQPASGVSSSTGTATVDVDGKTAAHTARRRIRAYAAYASSSAFLRTKHIDPVGIVLTSVKNTISFQYGNGCIHNPVTMTYSDSWFSTDGWTRDSLDFAHDASCSDAYSSNLETFHNSVFCAGSTTYSTYNRNSIHAKPDGTFAVYPNDSWSGGCASLIHREYDYDFGTDG